MMLVFLVLNLFSIIWGFNMFNFWIMVVNLMEVVLVWVRMFLLELFGRMKIFIVIMRMIKVVFRFNRLIMLKILLWELMSFMGKLEGLLKVL